MRPKASDISDSNRKRERREEKSSAEGLGGLRQRGFQGDSSDTKWGNEGNRFLSETGKEGSLCESKLNSNVLNRSYQW